MSKGLAERAMLVDLSIKQWQATTHDRRVSREVADTHNSDVNMGRYNKQLLAKGALSQIKLAANLLRAEHYRRTLPFGDNGERLLSSEGYLGYTAACTPLKDRFEAAVNQFIPNYPGLIADAQYRLNGLFNPAEYPTPDEIARKFYVGFQFRPIPSGNNFIVDIGNSERARIAAEIEAALKSNMDVAMADVFGRIKEHVGHMAERLRAYGQGDSKNTGAFRDTLVENVKGLVELLPSLNVTNNPEITALTQIMADTLCVHSAQELRESPTARAATAIAADEIVAKMSEFI